MVYLTRPFRAWIPARPQRRYLTATGKGYFYSCDVEDIGMPIHHIWRVMLERTPLTSASTLRAQCRQRVGLHPVKSRRRPAALLLVLSCALLACGDRASDRGPGDTPAVWEAGSDPLVIGSASSAFPGDLYGIMGVAQLSDGRVVVADRAQRLVVFDSGGSYLNTIGRSGSGPGEFTAIALLNRVQGDSLFVYDGRQFRVSLFTAGGELARTFQIRAPRPFRVRGRFHDGSVLLQRELNAPLDPGIVRSDYVVLRIAEDGTVLDSLMTVPGTEFFYGGERGPSVVVGTFLRETYMAAGARAAYAVTGDRFEVQVASLDPTAGGRRLFQRSVPTAPLTTADITAALPAADARALLPLLPPDQTVPLTLRLVVDEDGNVWVEEYRADRDLPATWSVFDPEGNLIATATTPARFRPFYIDDKVILGVSRDSLGVELVHRHTLLKSARN
jgi:hypothetical protein